MSDAPVIRRAHVAAFTSALMIAQQVAGKATRDALFLSSFGSSHLPFVMASGAILSLLAVWGLSSLMARHSPAAIAPLLFAVSAVAFALEWILQLRAPREAAGLVYLHTALLGPVTISTFWSLVNEHFEPYTAKNAVARIAFGGTLGGVLGGLASWRASTVVQPGTMLSFLAGINALAAVGALFVSDRAERSRASTVSPVDMGSSRGMVSTFGILRGTPFLRNLAYLVALGSATTALLDYIFSTEAVGHFGKGQALLSFFSLFWLGVGVLSFLLQLSLGRVALEKLGLALNIAVLPGIILLGGALGLAVPGLISATLLRGGEAVQRNTLFRSAYELMYAPLAEKRKRATKALIDIGFDRVGTIAGSGLTLVALHFAGHQSAVLLGSVVALALATLPVTRQLHLGYVEALQESLRADAEKLESAPVSQRLSDPSRAVPSPEREQLIERLEELQPGGLTALVDPNFSAGERANEPPSMQDSASTEEALRVAAELTSGVRERVERALGQLAPGEPGVAFAIRLLGDPRLYTSAVEALSNLARVCTGQLIDALVDPGTDFDIRRRLPRILCKSSTQRAAEGLLLGIADERFEVRYECGRALFKLTDGDCRVVVSQAKAIAAIRREIDSTERILADRAAEAEDVRRTDEQDRLIQGLRQDRVNRSLQHVFNVLCLHLEREPLRIAFRGLHHPDTNFRGTALEYLSTVLPEEIRSILWPYLGESTPLPPARDASALLRDLERAEPSLISSEVRMPGA